MINEKSSLIELFKLKVNIKKLYTSSFYGM